MKKILLFGIFSLLGNLAFSQDDPKPSTTIYEDVKNLYNTVNPPEVKEQTTADQLQELREEEQRRDTPDPAVENARQRQQEIEAESKPNP